MISSREVVEVGNSEALLQNLPTDTEFHFVKDYVIDNCICWFFHKTIIIEHTTELR